MALFIIAALGIDLMKKITTVLCFCLIILQSEKVEKQFQKNYYQ